MINPALVAKKTLPERGDYLAEMCEPEYAPVLDLVSFYAKISATGTEKPGNRSEQSKSSLMVRMRTSVNER